MITMKDQVQQSVLELLLLLLLDSQLQMKLHLVSFLHLPMQKEQKNNVSHSLIIKK